VPLQHSFTDATVAAHRDVLRAVRAMPGLVWTVVAILVFQIVLEVVLTRFIPRSSLFGHDIARLSYYALLTPFFIAIHRFIILGEVTRSYRLQWQDLRFQMFFGWAVTLFVLARLTTLSNVLPQHWMIQVLAFVMVVAICVLLTRVIILFPAIAVDAPGATPRNAFDDTRGHGWYIFFLFVVPFIPSAVIIILIALLAVRVQPVAGSILLVPLLTMTVLLWVTMAVVIASRLYQALGDRLNQPAAA
jgi:hypothetical protein